MPTNNTLSRFANNIVSISSRNEKLGDIKSVSLPAVKTCNPSAPCFKYCYARKLAAYRSNVGKSYEKQQRKSRKPFIKSNLKSSYKQWRRKCCGDYSSDYNAESENIYNTNGGENEEAEGCCGCITLIVLILLILLIFNGCQRIGHAIFSPEKGHKPAVTKTIDENITTEKAFDKDFSNGY